MIGRTPTLAAAAVITAQLAFAQGRPSDWPFYGGDAQRSGWEKSDTRITKENVKTFQLVLKRKLGGRASNGRSLSPPAIIGMLISYRGFKELGFVADSSDNVWAIDVDLNRVFWQKHLETTPAKTKASPSCAAPMPTLVPPLNFSAAPPKPVESEKPRLAFLRPAPFGTPRPVFALASDGKLHVLNTANGVDLIPPVPFLPPGARGSSLTFADGIVYAATSSACGSAPDAIWAVDLNTENEGDQPHVSHFVTNGGSASTPAGIAIATDGTVYAQTGSGEPPQSNSLVALSPHLEPTRSFQFRALSKKKPAGKKATIEQNGAAPLLFRFKERSLVAAAGPDGRIYLADAAPASKEDPWTPLFQTEPVGTGARIWGGLSTWEDADGGRFLYAPVWGPLNPDLAQMAPNGPPQHGAILAFRVEDHDGKPILTPAWVSHDMPSPEPPVITAGTVFALSAGEYGRNGQPKNGAHATLFALEAATGGEVYSTGNQVDAPGNLNGVTIANARVYFTTVDSTLYAFGIYLER